MKPKIGQKVVAKISDSTGTLVDTVTGKVTGFDKADKTNLVIVQVEEATDPGTVSTAWAFDLGVFHKIKPVNGVFNIEAEGA